MFGTITGPTNKVLVTTTTPLCVEYFVNEIFIVAIWCGDRRWFFHTVRWEKRDIGFGVREDLQHVEDRENIRRVGKVEGDGGVIFVNIDNGIWSIKTWHKFCNMFFPF